MVEEIGDTGSESKIMSKCHPRQGGKRDSAFGEKPSQRHRSKGV